MRARMAWRHQDHVVGEIATLNVRMVEPGLWMLKVGDPKGIEELPEQSGATGVLRRLPVW